MPRLNYMHSQIAEPRLLSPNQQPLGQVALTPLGKTASAVFLFRNARRDVLGRDEWSAAWNNASYDIYKGEQQVTFTDDETTTNFPYSPGPDMSHTLICRMRKTLDNPADTNHLFTKTVYIESSASNLGNSFLTPEVTSGVHNITFRTQTSTADDLDINVTIPSIAEMETAVGVVRASGERELYTRHGNASASATIVHPLARIPDEFSLSMTQWRTDLTSEHVAFAAVLPYAISPGLAQAIAHNPYPHFVKPAG